MAARRPATDPAKRAEALKLADAHGCDEASRRTGVPEGTIRSWRARSGQVAPPAGADPVDWADRKQRGAAGAYAAAVQALVTVRDLLVQGKTREARDAAVTFGVLTDKTASLEEAAERAAERQAAVAEGQAQLLAEVVRVYFDAVGLPFDAGGRKLLAGLLRQASEPGVALAASPEYAEMARRELVEALAGEIRARLPDLEPEWEERRPLGLPAPRDDEGDQEAARGQDMI